MILDKKPVTKREGLLFGVSFAYMFLGPLIFLVPLLLVLFTYDSNFSYNIDYFTSSSFLIPSLIADSASKIVLIMFFLVVFYREFKLAFYKLKKEFPKNITIIIGGTALMFILLAITNVIYAFFGIEGDSSNQEILITATKSSFTPIMFFMIVISAPFVEEMIFRRLLFGFVENTLKLSQWWALAISSFVFAAIHVISDPSSYIFIFQYLILAVVISFSYVLSNKNIIVPIAIHLINNLISFIAIILL